MSSPEPVRAPSLGMLESSNRIYRAVEILAVISMVLVIAGLALPVMRHRHISADLERAQSDMESIAAAIRRFYADTRSGPTRDRQGNDKGLLWLVSPGRVWNEEFAPRLRDSQMGRLDEHLVANAPGPRTYESWEGPYLEEVRADPWGHRYLAVLYPMYLEDDRDCIIVSAGPNGRLESGALSPRDLIPAGDDLVITVFDKSGAHPEPLF